MSRPIKLMGRLPFTYASIGWVKLSTDCTNGEFAGASVVRVYTIMRVDVDVGCTNVNYEEYVSLVGPTAGGSSIQ